MWPLSLLLRRVSVAYALHVQRFVEVLEKVQSHNTIVGTLVLVERSAAQLGLPVECRIYAARVEDLIDTADSQSPASRVIVSLLTTENRHSV